MLLLMLMRLVMLKFFLVGLGRCWWWWECLVLVLICIYRRWEFVGSVSVVEWVSIVGLMCVSFIRSSFVFGVVEYGGYSWVFLGVLFMWGFISGCVWGCSLGLLYWMKVLCREVFIYWCWWWLVVVVGGGCDGGVMII